MKKWPKIKILGCFPLLLLLYDVSVIVRGLVLLVTGLVSAQTDDFSCPDRHAGFYPHLYSCDKVSSQNKQKIKKGNGIFYFSNSYQPTPLHEQLIFFVFYAFLYHFLSRPFLNEKCKLS